MSKKRVAADPEAAIEEIVAAVSASRRYRSVHPATVRRVARAQLQVAGGRVPDAIKRSKRALHQFFGAYLPKPPRWARLLAELQDADTEEAQRSALRHAMEQHASTRERAPHLEAIAEELGRHIPSPSSVLDLACGLQPLAAPWLGWGPALDYFAWDIDVAMIEFVEQCLCQLGITSHASVVDLLDVESWPTVDVALVLKTLPCLEQQRAGASEALLDALPAAVTVVSFPTRSLSGRSKGMHATYARGFEAILGARSWAASTFEIGPELFYVVRRPTG